MGPILLFTDFGLEGPYIGQLRAVLAARAPDVPVIDLFPDVPCWDPETAACLLRAVLRDVPAPLLCLAVVDPGVGTSRRGIVVEADERVLVGPDNGLFSAVVASARTVRCWEIDYRPRRLSRTFHGRDLFAPVVARLATGQPVDELAHPIDAIARGPVSDLDRILYIDRFGNAMTGIDGDGLDLQRRLWVAGRRLPYAETFASVPVGQAFWYVNALGLVEIAVNQGAACDRLGLSVGDPVGWNGPGRP